MFIVKWRKLLVFIGDIGLFYAALAAALFLRHLEPISLEFFTRHAFAFSFFLPVWAAVFYSIGFYDVRQLNKLVALIHRLLAGFIVNSAAAAVIFYLFYPQLGFTPKTHLFLTLVFFHAFATIWRRLWTRVFFQRLMVQRVAFIGGNPLIDEIRRLFTVHTHLGFVMAPIPDIKLLAAGADGDWRPRGRRLGFGLDLIVVAAEYADKNPVLKNYLLSTAAMAGIPVVTHLDFYEELYGKIPPEHASQTGWLLENVLSKKNPVYAKVKRGLDVVLALIGFVATLPLMLLVYLGLLLEGGARGGPFYFQKRVGYLGKRFILWKFRTMARGADKAGPFAGARAKEHATAFGRFLRFTRLDELPQLWNILRGDMSLVGPRPEWIQEVSRLERNLPHYHLRHLVKPGLTGWAQIHMSATSGEKESFEKLHYDLFYVKNMSLALDIGIILRTFRRVFQSDASLALRASAAD